MNATRQNENDRIIDFRLPKVSARKPVGNSNMLMNISRIAYNSPIEKKDRPASMKNSNMKGSKKRRFFRNP